MAVVSNRVSLAIAAALAVPASACEPDPAEPSRNLTASERSNVRTSALRAGDRPHPEPVQNPYANDDRALQEGKRLYTWFNCAGCHGAIGGGAIGPPLRDEVWIYGSDPQNVYRSIVEGRPQGMPAFGDAIPADALWKLVAFVRSLGGEPPAEQRARAMPEPEEAAARPESEPRAPD